MNLESIPILAGQVLVAGYQGEDPPAWVTQRLNSATLGGVILFRRNIRDVEQVSAALTRCCEAAADDFPPLTAVDQEGGRVARLKSPVLSLPPMRALGDIDDPSFTQALAHALGTQLRAIGFNMNFAPVLDVDTNPANPVIGDRSFGRSPNTVIRHGMAFAEGLERSGIMACAKHFPGHGDTDLDSHLALPRLSHAMQRLEEIELAPFRAAIATNTHNNPQAAWRLSSIMTAHVVFDALRPETPATLAPEVIDGLLRRKLGFEGLIVSDDLEMKALSAHGTYADSAVRAIDAGCDVVLVCSQEDALSEAHQGLIKKAESSQEFANKLRRAATRHLLYRRARPPEVLTDQRQRAEILSPKYQTELQERLASLLCS